MPTKQTPTTSTRSRKASENLPVTSSPSQPRRRKPKDVEPDVAPSLGGATETLPAIDPILPPTDIAAKRAAKAAAPKVEAKAKPVDAEPKGPRTTAVTEGTQVCRTCERELPITKFPTKSPDKDGTVGRDTQCRSCRENIRLANKAGK